MSVEKPGICPKTGVHCAWRAAYEQNLAAWKSTVSEIEQEKSSLAGRFRAFSSKLMPIIGQPPERQYLKEAENKVAQVAGVLALNCSASVDCIVRDADSATNL